MMMASKIRDKTKQALALNSPDGREGVLKDMGSEPASDFQEKPHFESSSNDDRVKLLQGKPLESSVYFQENIRGDNSGETEARNALKSTPFATMPTKALDVSSLEDVGNVRDGVNHLDQEIDRLLSKWGVPDAAREPLKQKWLTDIRAAKDEVTDAKRVAPIGWRVLSPAEKEEAIAHGKSKPWKNDDGTRNGDNLFEWIFDEYQTWIPGLTQKTLKAADFSLWSDLQTTISNARKGWAVVPAWFKIKEPEGERLLVPADKDARLLSIADPAERKAFLALRKQKTTAKAAARARPTREPKVKGISNRAFAK